jgi:hypothetical protein
VPPEPEVDETGARLPIEALVGAGLLMLVLSYTALYAHGLAQGNRYAKGFVFATCPICQRGEPLLEARQERWFGVPHTRWIARCTECRSVLRETGSRRWRYAVDPLENPFLFERFNGREVDDDMLRELARRAPEFSASHPPRPVTPPAFVDDEDEQ